MPPLHAIHARAQGMTSSADDWYILGSGMVVTETSLDVYNEELYKKVTASSLMSWQRVLVANLMSDDGATWAEHVAFQNSGERTGGRMLAPLWCEPTHLPTYLPTYLPAWDLRVWGARRTQAGCRAAGLLAAGLRLLFCGVPLCHLVWQKWRAVAMWQYAMGQWATAKTQFGRHRSERHIPC